MFLPTVMTIDSVVNEPVKVTFLQSLKEQMKRFRKIDREFGAVLGPQSPSFIDKGTWISRENQELIQDTAVKMSVAEHTQQKNAEHTQQKNAELTQQDKSLSTKENAVQLDKRSHNIGDKIRAGFKKIEAKGADIFEQLSNHTKKNSSTKSKAINYFHVYFLFVLPIIFGR